MHFYKYCISHVALHYFYNILYIFHKQLGDDRSVNYLKEQKILFLSTSYLAFAWVGSIIIIVLVLSLKSPVYSYIAQEFLYQILNNVYSDFDLLIFYCIHKSSLYWKNDILVTSSSWFYHAVCCWCEVIITCFCVVKEIWV